MDASYQVVGCALLLTLIPTVLAQTRTEFINAIISDYDSKVTPTFDRGTPTEVDVSLFINSIDSVSEQTMDFTINAFIIQEWHDKRLDFMGLINSEYLELDSKLIDQIWVPDLYFANEKRASFHTVTVPNKMLHLYSDGRIIYRLRVSITATCSMKLHKYPLDMQVSTLFIQSFAFSKRSLQFRWSEKPVDRNPDLEMPQFTLEHLAPRNCTNVGGENFTCLALDFYLSRNIGFYMIQIYVPSTLIVMLSWVSFWLNVDAVPARISLGILTVLTMTTQKSSAISSLPKLLVPFDESPEQFDPKVSYIKAIDVWMAACLCFVFSALLEFALVNVMDRKGKKTPPAPAADILHEVSPLKGDGAPTVFRAMERPSGHRNALRVDYTSRVLFPAAFTLFTLIYWIAYLHSK